MAEARVEQSIVPLKLIETWKQDNVCFFCKEKSFKDKLKCGKCLEFEYCSIECLENDRAAHEAQCNFISVLKGLRRWVPKSFLDFITSRGKLLDVTGDVKDEKEARRELEAIMRLKSTVVNKMSDPVQNRQGENRRKKRKNKQAKDADDKYFPIRQQRVSLPVYDIVSGTFGRPVTCSRRELSGQEFGQGWWKNGSETSSPLKASAPSSHVVLETIKITDQDFARMTSAELYPDSDEDTFSEVNGNQQTQSNKTRRIPNKSKGKGSRKTKKPEVHVRGEEARSTKPKPPKSNTVKADVCKTKKEEVSEKCCKQTDGGPQASACCFCGKRGNALKSCMGCKKSKYCDKNCQSKDYKNHSIQCKRYQRFQQAVKNIPTAMLAAMCTGVSLNPLSLTFEQKEIGRLLHQTLLLEIVQANLTMFGIAVMTVDSIGRNIFLSVFLSPDIPFEKMNGKTGVVTMVTLHTCLRPGNFILLFDPNCVAFLNGTPTFEISVPEGFSFVFNDHPPTS